MPGTKSKIRTRQNIDKRRVFTRQINDRALSFIFYTRIRVVSVINNRLCRLSIIRMYGR